MPHFIQLIIMRIRLSRLRIRLSRLRIRLSRLRISLSRMRWAYTSLLTLAAHLKCDAKVQRIKYSSKY